MGSLNMGNQGKMGFWESSWGVVAKILQKPFYVVFWYLVPIPLLSFSSWSTILSAVPKIIISILISTACCGLGNSYI